LVDEAFEYKGSVETKKDYQNKNNKKKLTIEYYY